ncbi:ABC transporter ATP-binding protein [Alkalihalobacterium bogoriense]|uniref:ABC transporter ATP-binding protein n=1 Tax=Alkalihalobacterium bogoriense TaxID=246272 RepID=UPI00047D40BF|nr:ABC transporter ATP-binding protein [Alkalihalobacterium bogoriense]
MFQLKNIKVNGILTIPDLTIPTLKTTSIIGPSGSGKTTLLRLLNNVSSADEGKIFYNEELLTSIDPIQLRRNVVMLQQHPIIFEGSVGDNLQTGLRFSNKSLATEEEMKTLLHAFRIKADLTKDAMLLSGGEKQRLALARVLLMKPEVLLLDEPTSALDEDTAFEVMNQLLGFTKHISCTVLFISHSKAIIDTFAEHIIDLSYYSHTVLTKEVSHELCD